MRNFIGKNKSTIISFRGMTNSELYIISFINKLAKVLSADIIYVEDFENSDQIYWYLENEKNKIINIFFLRFSWLILAKGLHKKSSKIRIFYEQDAALNYINVTGMEYLGAWTKYLPLLGSNLLITNDKNSRDRFLAENISAYWSPKAASNSFLNFSIKKQKQFNIGYYGAQYGARAHALASMKKNNVEISRFIVPYEKLSERISSCRAILICNNQNKYLIPWFKRVQRKFPLIFIEPKSGWQVLAKNYEVCAANSLMFADYIEEMSDLGFKSGVNCLLYHDTAEMVDMARWIISHPDRVEEMAELGFHLVAERHTWDHRADDLSNFLKTKFLMKFSDR